MEKLSRAKMEDHGYRDLLSFHGLDPKPWIWPIRSVICRVRFLISGQSSTHNWEMDFRYQGKDADYDDTFAKKKL